MFCNAVCNSLEIDTSRKIGSLDDEEVKKIFQEGAEKLRPIAQATIKEVKEKMGLEI